MSRKEVEHCEECGAIIVADEGAFCKECGDGPFCSLDCLHEHEKKHGRSIGSIV